jgi:hypothetical protein
MATKATTQGLRSETGARAHSGGPRTLWNRSGHAAAGRKGDWRKRLLAAMVQKETTMRLDRISDQLNMGTRAGTCRLAAESRKRLAAGHALRKEVETILEKAIFNG